MINEKSLQREWIESVARSQKADISLVEKVIRALVLLENLTKTNLDFCFRGGTALMLLLGKPKRLSIDIDIICPGSQSSLLQALDSMKSENTFLRYEKQLRNTNSLIQKEHYKIYFISVVSGKESYILLDVLYEKILYTSLQNVSIENDLLDNTGEPKIVIIPDKENILADKLTAFAPNTVGIPYLKKDKEMGMEIIKQLYDIGVLFELISDIDQVRRVLDIFVELQLKYRNTNLAKEEIYRDVFSTAISICLRKDHDPNSRFDILNKGIKQVKPFIFSEIFHLEKAITFSSKIVFLILLLSSDQNSFARYSNKTDMSSWIILPPFDTKLNKLKKSNPEAFYYLYMASKLK